MAKLTKPEGPTSEVKKVGFWKKLRKSKSSKNVAVSLQSGTTQQDSEEIVPQAIVQAEPSKVDLVIANPSVMSRITSDATASTEATSLDMMFSRTASTGGVSTYAFTPPAQLGELVGALNPHSLFQLRGFASAVDIPRSDDQTLVDEQLNIIETSDRPVAARLSWAEGCDSRLSYCNQRLQGVGSTKSNTQHGKKVPGTPYPISKDFKWDSTTDDEASSKNESSAASSSNQTSPRSASSVWTAQDIGAVLEIKDHTEHNQVEDGSDSSFSTNHVQGIDNGTDTPPADLDNTSSDPATNHETSSPPVTTCTVELKPTGNFAMDMVQRLSQIAFGFA